jgi:hypothetical protein
MRSSKISDYKFPRYLTLHLYEVFEEALAKRWNVAVGHNRLTECSWQYDRTWCVVVEFYSNSGGYSSEFRLTPSIMTASFLDLPSTSRQLDSLQIRGNVILYFSILLHCIVQWVLQVMGNITCKIIERGNVVG